MNKGGLRGELVEGGRLELIIPQHQEMLEDGMVDIIDEHHVAQ